jgi:hypothetical protein
MPLIGMEMGTKIEWHICLKHGRIKFIYCLMFHYAIASRAVATKRIMGGKYGKLFPKIGIL